METALSKDLKNKRISLAVTITIHAILFLIFMMLTKIFGPPYPEGPGPIGVEVNFGTSDAGMGSDQQESFSESQSTEAAKPEEAASQDVTESPNEEDISETPDTKVQDNSMLTSDDSPVELNTKPNTSKASPAKKPVEDVKPDPNKKKNNENGGGGKDGLASAGSSGSNGNQNVMGDQGKTYGALNKKAIYDGKPGNGGGGNGHQLDLDGWEWEKEPSRVDPSNETGFIIFEISVDDYGTITKAIPKKWTVSPSVIAFYKKQLLEETSLARTGSNIVNNKGTVRFDLTN
jgi:hypothetical protein